MYIDGKNPVFLAPSQKNIFVSNNNDLSPKATRFWKKGDTLASRGTPFSSVASRDFPGRPEARLWFLLAFMFSLIQLRRVFVPVPQRCTLQISFHC